MPKRTGVQTLFCRALLEGTKRLPKEMYDAVFQGKDPCRECTPYDRMVCDVLFKEFQADTTKYHN